MPISERKFEQVLKHFSVEVMERALGLGDRYTTMDSVISPMNCNNAMIGSLIPNSVIDTINRRFQSSELSSEDEELNEIDLETQSYSNSSYYFDIFLKNKSKGLDIDIKLEYWTTPSTPNNTLPSSPYSLRGDENQPLSYIDQNVNWIEDNFHLPYDDIDHVGRLISEDFITLTPNDSIRKNDFEITSNLIEDSHGKYQRITLNANGERPLLYPILKLVIKNIDDILYREISREKLNEKTGKRYEDFYKVWFRTTRCQTIPLKAGKKGNSFPLDNELNPLGPLEGLGEITPFLFISPISMFIEKQVESVEVGNLLMSELFEDPIKSIDKIIQFFKENNREDLATKLDNSVNIIKNNQKYPHAISALKAVNLTYYNYFIKRGFVPPKWRLFQWTYVLMSFSDFLQKRDLSDQFDFIGVRTGGGKTEAYIALTLALGFYQVFNGQTPESITLVRFPRRTLVIDQYVRVISLLSWANIVLKYYIQQDMIKKPLTLPSDYFTAALLLGNEFHAEIPYSPRSIEDLYPTIDSNYRDVRKPGTYGIKGSPESDNFYRNGGDETPEVDSQNLDIRWIKSNLIQAVREFKDNRNDLITPAARNSYPIKNCPICDNPIRGIFDFDQLRPTYWCTSTNHEIHIPNQEKSVVIDGDNELFMFRTDEELVRYRSTVVVGTLDKLPHIFINSQSEIGESIKGCFGENGTRCSLHGFYGGEYRNRCAWNKSRRGLFGGITRFNCGDIENHPGKSFKILVHDEVHMFDDVVGGLNSPFERVFLKKLGKTTKVMGMSATLSNVSDVSENLCNRHTIAIYPPEFFFNEINKLRRIHIGGLISIPREKRQFKAMHIYIFQTLLTWLYSDNQRNIDLNRIQVPFIHPLIQLEPVILEEEEIEDCLNLLCRWVGYVRKKPNGEILWRDFNAGLEVHSRNYQDNRDDPINQYYGESYYPFFGYISGDYPFDELTNELDNFKEAISTTPRKIPRALISTNILSVGVDISNLSIILFHGRPDKIAEYVQSSGRVGRGKPGLSIVSFTPSEVIAKDLFSVFSRDMTYRYELIEPSYFNPHSIGIIRETMLPVLQMIMHLNLNRFNDNTNFNNQNIIELIREIYFDHLVRRGDQIPDFSNNYIQYVLNSLENEYNRNSLNYNTRLKFITPPRGRDEQRTFDQVWSDINSRYSSNPIPFPKTVNVRSVGDQIDIRGRGYWEIYR